MLWITTKALLVSFSKWRILFLMFFTMKAIKIPQTVVTRLMKALEWIARLITFHYTPSSSEIAFCMKHWNETLVFSISLKVLALRDGIVFIFLNYPFSVPFLRLWEVSMGYVQFQYSLLERFWLKYSSLQNLKVLIDMFLFLFSFQVEFKVT